MPEPRAARSAQAVDDRKPRDDGPPTPPWAPLPLTEIAVVIALVMLVAGFLTGGSTGMAVLLVGLVLGSAAGIEQALREHRAGYRSHSAVLAAMPAVALVALLAAVGVQRELLPFIGIGVGAMLWMPIRSDWKRRSAGSGDEPPGGKPGTR